MKGRKRARRHSRTTSGRRPAGSRAPRSPNWGCNAARSPRPGCALSGAPGGGDDLDTARPERRSLAGRTPGRSPRPRRQPLSRRLGKPAAGRPASGAAVPKNGLSGWVGAALAQSERTRPPRRGAQPRRPSQPAAENRRASDGHSSCGLFGRCKPVHRLRQVISPSRHDAAQQDAR
ncbi:MAG: hypothetical protein B6D39_00665 [Anaerolineae bacterium UTCFX2]|nr:MAG: hypothetical protein B6D39_00665 [Anaerolineae bacterium UTCFX2]